MFAGKYSLKIIYSFRFAAMELSCIPEIRKKYKELITNNSLICTEPTEQGEKDLDEFNPSYKIKRINDEPLRNFLANLDDRFIDIMRNANLKLITYKIIIDKDSE